MREAWFPITALLLVLASCTLYLRWFYLPERLDYEPDTAFALFETLKLLIFQTDLDLPDELIGRALFFLLRCSVSSFCCKAPLMWAGCWLTNERGLIAGKSRWRLPTAVT